MAPGDTRTYTLYASPEVGETVALVRDAGDVLGHVGRGLYAPGDPIRLHVLAPWSEQAQVFALEGHTWPQECGLEGTPQLASRRIGGLQALTLHIAAAGGPDQLPGDYLYGNHRVP